LSIHASEIWLVYHHIQLLLLAVSRPLKRIADGLLPTQSGPSLKQPASRLTDLKVSFHEWLRLL